MSLFIEVSFSSFQHMLLLSNEWTFFGAELGAIGARWWANCRMVIKSCFYQLTFAMSDQKCSFPSPWFCLETHRCNHRCLRTRGTCTNVKKVQFRIFYFTYLARRPPSQIPSPEMNQMRSSLWLNAHTCINFGLNAHTMCTNIGLNAHTLRTHLITRPSKLWESSLGNIHIWKIFTLKNIHLKNIHPWKKFKSPSRSLS